MMSNEVKFEEDKSIFSQRIKKLRTTPCETHPNGYTTAEVVEALQLTSPQILWNYENGKREPDFNILISFSKFYHVTTDYLLGQSNDKNPKVNDISSTGLSDYAVNTLRQYNTLFEDNRVIRTLNALFETRVSIDGETDINSSPIQFEALPAILRYICSWLEIKKRMVENPISKKIIHSKLPKKEWLEELERVEGKRYCLVSENNYLTMIESSIGKILAQTLDKLPLDIIPSKEVTFNGEHKED